MLFIVTAERATITEFRGVFRTRQQAETFIAQNDVGATAAILTDNSFVLSPQPTKVYVAQSYFEPEDLFGYAGVFDTFAAAHTRSGRLGGVLTYDL